MRKGFTLVEMLIVIMTLPFVALVLDGLFNTLLTDIPRSCRVLQDDTTLLSMLQQFQQDIDAAKALPDSFAGYSTDDKLLLIELAEGAICYQLEDGRVLRRRLTDTQQGREEPRVWSMPNAQVEWRLWRQQGHGYAVEVKTHIKHRLRKKLQEKMANSHLYFLGVL
jgi:prepilin-type N-terminal cleavage/methylation domain-containing protein